MKLSESKNNDTSNKYISIRAPQNNRKFIESNHTVFYSYKFLWIKN